jgi:hypothetical protein
MLKQAFQAKAMHASLVPSLFNERENSMSFGCSLFISVWSGTEDGSGGDLRLSHAVINGLAAWIPEAQVQPLIDDVKMMRGFGASPWPGWPRRQTDRFLRDFLLITEFSCVLA